MEAPWARKAAEARFAALQAFDDARAAGDVDAMGVAALALPLSRAFMTDPGQVPAVIHEAYAAASRPELRTRLAAALARAWAYGGHAQRGVPFADEALSLAETVGAGDLLAEALDAALVVRWGPDDFDARVRLAARLAETAAHLTDPEARLSAYLWRLTTAWECLDIVAVHRQLRALDVLVEETAMARVAFFAASRRAMHLLTSGDLEAADVFLARTQQLGDEVAEPDVEGVLHALTIDRARQAGDTPRLRSEAEQYEEYGVAHGVQSVLAEGMKLWHEAGEPDRAEKLLTQLAAQGVDAVPRDVDFLFTVTRVVEVAAAAGVEEVCVQAVALLEPYAGRAVLNSGAVAFLGVVDEYLWRANQALGKEDADAWRQRALSAYRRVGAPWWERRVTSERRESSGITATFHLHPDSAGAWTVGPEGATRVLPDLKGLHYLRHLVRRPGVDVGAGELAAAVAGHPVMPDSDAGELIDKQALVAYRKRLADIDADLREAESWSDEARRERLVAERDALLEEVRVSTGLGGKRRRVGATNERARMAVRKAIVAALDRVDERDPALARLLRDAVHTGATCRYDPDPGRPVVWLTG